MADLTLGEVVAAITVITALWIFYDRVTKSIDDSFTKHLAPLTKDIKDLQERTDMINDVIYVLLEHEATSNNTGEMKRALDEYNKWNRKH